MAMQLNLLNTIQGSLLEGFYPQGWDLKRIDKCCDMGLRKVTAPARHWSDDFKPVPVREVKEMDRRMGDAIATRSSKIGRAHV